MNRSSIKMVILCCLFACCPQIGRAEWDFDDISGTDNYELLLDTDGDVDLTFVDVRADGDRIKFLVAEFVAGEMVDYEEFRERFDDEDESIVIIEGSPKDDYVQIHSDVYPNIRVIIRGHDGNDHLGGGWQIFAGAGDDIAANAVEIRGGSGENRLYGGPMTKRIYGGEQDDLINAERVEQAVEIFAARGKDHITGSPFGDYIDAGAGNDTVFGREGDDVIIGGPPTQSVEDKDLIVGEEGSDQIYAGVDDDIVYGGAGSDSIVGEPGIDILVGGANVDFLQPGPFEGSEWLFGQDGADFFLTYGRPDDYFTDYDYRELDRWIFGRPPSR